MKAVAARAPAAIDRRGARGLRNMPLRVTRRGAGVQPSGGTGTRQYEGRSPPRWSTDPRAARRVERAMTTGETAVVVLGDDGGAPGRRYFASEVPRSHGR